MEHRKQLQSTLLRLALCLVVAEPVRYGSEKVAFCVVVQAHLDVVEHRHVGKQADVLERACNAKLVDLVSAHAERIYAVKQDGASRGAVNVRKQVEHRRLACAVRTDQAANLRAAHGEVKIVHSGKTAEINAEVAHI